MKPRKTTFARAQAEGSIDWLLLVVSLPTESATARMRIWRALKAIGCRALRDGAYLLPAGDGRAETLHELADECTREGGNAWLMTVRPRSAEEADAYRALFDRADDYAELRRACASTSSSAPRSRLSAARLFRQSATPAMSPKRRCCARDSSARRSAAS